MVSHRLVLLIVVECTFINIVLNLVVGIFRKSGYDRGHLAAAANHRSSQDSMCATFFLSNMSPQVGEQK